MEHLGLRNFYFSLYATSFGFTSAVSAAFVSDNISESISRYNRNINGVGVLLSVVNYLLNYKMKEAL